MLAAPISLYLTNSMRISLCTMGVVYIVQILEYQRFGEELISLEQDLNKLNSFIGRATFIGGYNMILVNVFAFSFLYLNDLTRRNMTQTLVKLLEKAKESVKAK
jgi:hypothetical protein